MTTETPKPSKESNDSPSTNDPSSATPSPSARLVRSTPNSIPKEERTQIVAERATSDSVDQAPFEARVFPRWMRITLLGLSVLLVLVVVALILFERKWFDPPSNLTDSYSREAVGHRAFFEVLKGLKLTPLRYRKEQGLDQVRAPLFLIMPEVLGSFHLRMDRIKDLRKLLEKTPSRLKQGERLQKAITSRIQQGLHTVVILPKWRIETSFATRTMEAKLLDLDFLRGYLHGFLPSTLPSPRIGRLDTRDEHAWSQTKGAPLNTELAFAQHFLLGEEQAHSSSEHAHWEAWLGDAKQALVIASKQKTPKEGRLWLVADPDPISNFRMDRSDHSYIFYTLIRDGLKADTIVLDEVSHGHGQHLSLRDELARFPNILLSIHACLLLLLAAWLGWVRFGVPLLPRPHPLRGPKEMLAITSRVLADGKRRPALVASYLLCLLEDIAQLLDLKKGSLLQRCEAIDRWCASRNLPEEAVSLYRTAMGLRSKEKAGGTGLLRNAQRAWSLRKQILEKRLRSVRAR